MRLSYIVSPCARRHKVPHWMLVPLIHCVSCYRLLVSPYKTVICSELPQCAASFYSKMWEVGAVLPLRRGGRRESSFQMWKVGVLSPDVGGGSCAAIPTRCGRWELRCAATPTRLEVGVLFPDAGGKSPLSKCGSWKLCCLSDEVWEVGLALPLRRGWRWESHNLTTRQHNTS